MHKFASSVFSSAVLLLCCSAAQAFSFVPRQDEWAAWPQHCKARYSMTPAATGSPYYGAISPDEIAQWRSRLTDYVWEHMHHYCAGLAWLHRAELETTKKGRKDALKSASREAAYTLRRLSPGMPLYGDVSIANARIAAAAGRYDSALRYVENGIGASPSDSRLYVAGYSVYRDAGQPAKAREMLERGDKATASASSEIQYFLGLEALERREYTQSVAYAKRAYELGYPLPGLKRKLAEAGYSLN